MLVYYFVPFIVSNRYLLFWVSNGHNSVTLQNRTHVYMNFFHHKELGNHLLQLCLKVVKHPVYIVWQRTEWVNTGGAKYLQFKGNYPWITERKWKQNWLRMNNPWINKIAYEYTPIGRRGEGQTKVKMDSSTLKKKDEYRMTYTTLLVMTMSWIF